MFKRLFSLVPVFLLIFYSVANSQEEKFVPGTVYLFEEEYKDNNIAKLLDPEKSNGGFVLDIRSFEIDLMRERLAVDVATIGKMPYPASRLFLDPISHLELDLSKWNTVLFLEMRFGYVGVDGFVHSNQAYATVYGRKMYQSGKGPLQLLQERKLLNSF